MNVIQVLILSFSGSTVFLAVLYVLKKFGFLDVENLVCTFRGANVDDSGSDNDIELQRQEFSNVSKRIAELESLLSLKVDALERKLHDDFFDQTSKILTLLELIRADCVSSGLKTIQQSQSNAELILRVEHVLLKNAPGLREARTPDALRRR